MARKWSPAGFKRWKRKAFEKRKPRSILESWEVSQDALPTYVPFHIFVEAYEEGNTQVAEYWKTNVPESTVRSQGRKNQRT